MNGTVRLTVNRLELDGQVVVVTAGDRDTGDVVSIRLRPADAPPIGAAIDVRIDLAEEQP